MRALILMFITGVLLGPTGLWADEDRWGLYIGSFDMVTEAHVHVMQRAVDTAGLKGLYISVNHGGRHTAKNFNASVSQRIEMVRLATQRLSVPVVVLREPLEGRQAFADYLIRKHDRILGIFGEDTFEKNFNIFAGTDRFDFIRAERPMVQTASTREAYVPTITDMVTDADGISSSMAREKIMLAQGTEGILDRQVRNFIDHEGLYLEVEASMEGLRNRWFWQLAHSVSHLYDVSSVEAPEFKATQSNAAFRDAAIRQLVAHLPDESLDAEFRLRHLLEGYFGLTLSERLRHTNLSPGLFYGSFDPIQPGQVEVIENQLLTNVDRLTVGVLTKSPAGKVIHLPAQERVAAAEKILHRFGNHVDVQVIDGDRIPLTVSRLANEFEEPLKVYFGSNVIQRNQQLLDGVEHIDIQPFPADFSVSCQRAMIPRTVGQNYQPVF